LLTVNPMPQGVSMDAVKQILVGPIVSRNGGFAFDTFCEPDGLKRGYPYRRVEQANYDRKTTLLALSRAREFVMTACETIFEFEQACMAPQADETTGSDIRHDVVPDTFAFQI
jgi:hypothetical protein